MFKKHVRRKCYNSSETAGLLHISAFSLSFPSSCFFFKVLLLENFVTKIKGSFRVNLGVYRGRKTLISVYRIESCTID